MIAFEAEVVEAAGDGRLRLRLANGHALEARSFARRPPRPGDRGHAALRTGPAEGWRFLPRPNPPPETPWPRKT